ncbi:hypothetical protein BGX26_002021 [Mortierella sp. AD094]|nr:hypothetical protein BGX26_002021 [Mortierella sp. AD094]
MGADWYTFVSTTIIGIPIPKEALKSKFEKKGFKIMTIKNETEYHGAFLCPKNTTIKTRASLDVMGPYEIETHYAQSKRMDHFNEYLPDDVKDALIKEYESFVGEEPEFAPGFWTVSCTHSYSFDLHSKWAMKSKEKLASEDDEKFSYKVKK